jgi:hypothetical protein
MFSSMVSLQHQISIKSLQVLFSFLMWVQTDIAAKVRSANVEMASRYSACCGLLNY